MIINIKIRFVLINLYNFVFRYYYLLCYNLNNKYDFNVLFISK